MKKQVSRKYYLVDARAKVLGRIAVRATEILSGKRKPDYTPNIDGGDFVVVTNTDFLVVTGRKLEQKKYHRFSGYPGGVRTASLKEVMKRDSRKAIEAAIFGMLPKNKLRDRMLKRLLLYRDEKHTHAIHETIAI